MRCRNPFVIVASLSLWLVASSCAHAAVSELNIDSLGGPRTALLLWPDSAGQGEHLPLVILLHGRGASAAGSLGLRKSVPAPLSAWVAIAERDRVAVLALQGSRGRSELAGWNDCRVDDPSKPEADDTAYANLALRQTLAQHPIDLGRIYLMGMSNGAMMTFRLSQELDQPVAALAAVAGTMPAGQGCPPPRRPLSVLLIHGTSDPLVPYQGGEVHFGTAEMGSVLSVDETAARWRSLDQIDAAARTEALPRLLASEGKTSAIRTVWGRDAAGLQVELIRIDGGGHAEPSVDHNYGRIYLGLAGPQNHDFESAEEAWRFFRTKRSPVS
jgi:polyhydroxybutyrate depolymerase